MLDINKLVALNSNNSGNNMPVATAEKGADGDAVNYKELEKVHKKFREAVDRLNDLYKPVYYHNGDKELCTQLALKEVARLEKQLSNYKITNYVITTENNRIYVKDKNNKKIVYLSLSKHNNKLIPENNTTFLIYNGIQLFTCPGATESCKKACYAQKVRGFSNIECRVRNTVTSMFSNFYNIMNEIIKRYTFNNTIIRVHESGDFYSIKYFKKWIQIIKENPDKQFLSYTKTAGTITQYLKEKENLKNYAYRFSLDNSSSDAITKRVIKEGICNYTMLDNSSQAQNIDPINLCNCNIGCASCKKCITSQKTIFVVKH